MEPTRLTYKALPGHITLGDLTNTEPTEVIVEGYAIPAHSDGAGFLERPGFDVINLHLSRETEFATAQATVYAPAGKWLHVKSCKDVEQWADDEAERLLK